MACLQKFSADLKWGCDSNLSEWKSTLGKYAEAILINASDIESFSGAGAGVALVLAKGKKGSVIEVINNSFKV